MGFFSGSTVNKLKRAIRKKRFAAARNKRQGMRRGRRRAQIGSTEHKPAAPTSGFKKLYDKKKAESKKPSQRDRLVSAIKNRQKKRSSVRDWFKSRGRR